jgi:hypothetical protein
MFSESHGWSEVDDVHVNLRHVVFQCTFQEHTILRLIDDHDLHVLDPIVFGRDAP